MKSEGAAESSSYRYSQAAPHRQPRGAGVFSGATCTLHSRLAGVCFDCFLSEDTVSLINFRCLVVRNSATRRYLSLLFIESLYYFYLNVGLFHSREEAQKGEIFRDPEPIVCFFFPSPTATTENVSDATNTARQRTPGFARFRAELVQ